MGIIKLPKLMGELTSHSFLPYIFSIIVYASGNGYKNSIRANELRNR